MKHKNTTPKKYKALIKKTVSTEIEVDAVNMAEARKKIIDTMHDNKNLNWKDDRPAGILSIFTA